VHLLLPYAGVYMPGAKRASSPRCGRSGRWPGVCTRLGATDVTPCARPTRCHAANGETYTRDQRRSNSSRIPSQGFSGFEAAILLNTFWRPKGRTPTSHQWRRIGASASKTATRPQPGAPGKAVREYSPSSGANPRGGAPDLGPAGVHLALSQMEIALKIVVIGGSGLIGTKGVNRHNRHRRGQIGPARARAGFCQGARNG